MPVFLCSLQYKRSTSDMFTGRLSYDKLFQQSVSSMSAETVRRVDSVLEVILLRSGPSYLPGFTSTRQDNDSMLDSGTCIMILYYFITRRASVAAALCIVIGPVCLWVCGCGCVYGTVNTITRN